MTRLHRVVIPVALMLVPTLARAQDREQLCHAVSRLPVGRWVEFQVSGLPEGMNVMRWSNVGTQDVEGVQHYWYEMKASGAGNLISQMLTSDVPGNIADLKEMVIQVEDQTPMRFTGEMLAMAAQQTTAQGTDIDEQCEDAELVGEEEVTVPAGAFNTVHLRARDGTGDFWLSSDVPFGIVRSVTKGIEMTLRGFGDGAVSGIRR